MVIERADRVAWPDSVLVEICEHLLAALQTFVNKEQHRDVVVTEFWILFDCLNDGLAAVCVWLRRPR